MRYINLIFAYLMLVEYLASSDSECEGYNCFRTPKDCTFTEEFDDIGCLIIKWTSTIDHVNFKISYQIAKGENKLSKGIYAGMALANTKEMEDGDAYVCEATAKSNNYDWTGSLKTYKLVGRKPPTAVDNPGIQNITFGHNTDLTSGIPNQIFCEFNRPHTINDTLEQKFSIYDTKTTSFYILTAFGKLAKIGGVYTGLDRHGHGKERRHSDVKIDFTKNPSNVNETTGSLTEGSSTVGSLAVGSSTVGSSIVGSSTVGSSTVGSSIVTTSSSNINKLCECISKTLFVQMSLAVIIYFFC